MANKLNDQELNNVSGGQGGYSSIIGDINSIKDQIKNIGGSVQSNVHYNYAILYLDSCVMDLSNNNTEVARGKLSKAISRLRNLSSDYPNLSQTIDNYINQIINIVSKF